MRRERHGVRLLAVVSLVAVAAAVCCLCGCPPKPQPTPPVAPPMATKQPTPAAPTGEPIKIGAIFSVTGKGSPLGDPEKKTAELLKDQINSSGGILGRPVDVIIKDDKSEPTEAVIAAKDLIDSQKVVAIIGPSATPTTMAIKDLCQKSQIPLLSCAAGKVITDPVASFVFAVPQTNTLAAQKIIDYLKAQKFTKVALMFVGDSFGQDGRDNVDKLAKEQGIELVASETFAGDATDMTAQLTRIKSKNPQAIICWGTNPGPALVCKNAATLGIKVPILMSHGVASGKFIELAGAAANGVQLPAGRLIVCEQVPAGDPQKQVLDKFAADYKAKYGASPNTFAGHAYDALWLVAKALEKAGQADRAKLRDAVEQTSGFVGTAGVFTYSAADHNGLNKDAFVWVKIVDGKWKLAE